MKMPYVEQFNQNRRQPSNNGDPKNDKSAPNNGDAKKPLAQDPQSANDSAKQVVSRGSGKRQEANAVKVSIDKGSGSSFDNPGFARIKSIKKAELNKKSVEKYESESGRGQKAEE